MSQHCLSCGACCANFRVSFYWGETNAHPQGTVPIELTSSINSHYVCMKGTDKATPRCVALAGNVGSQVSCTIYEQRSSTCREFAEGTDACNRARKKYGLPEI